MLGRVNFPFGGDTITTRDWPTTSAAAAANGYIRANSGWTHTTRTRGF